MTTAELSLLFQSSRFVPSTELAFARLELEPLVDTGNAVPIGIVLKAPSGLAFKSFEVFAPDNPVARVCKMTFGTLQANYRFEVRIRLGASQDVWLVATLSDGLMMGMRQSTVLTSSACFDAS